MTYTIQDLRDGKCAVVNDGTVEELNRVIGANVVEAQNLSLPCVIFLDPMSINPRWYSRFHYGKEQIFNGLEYIPTQSVHEFLKQL